MSTRPRPTAPLLNPSPRPIFILDIHFFDRPPAIWQEKIHGWNYARRRKHRAFA